MSLKLLPVGSGFFTSFLFLGVKPKTVFGSTEQKIDKSTGLPVWSVSLLGTYSAGAESITVSVPSADLMNELAGVIAPSPVLVSGLCVGAYIRGKYTEFYYTAESVKPKQNGFPPLAGGLK